MLSGFDPEAMGGRGGSALENGSSEADGGAAAVMERLCKFGRR
jgi:hypothetical protein